MRVFREHIIDIVDQACPENHLELVACDKGALAQVDVVKLFHVGFVVVLQDNAQTGCTVSGSGDIVHAAHGFHDFFRDLLIPFFFVHVLSPVSACGPICSWHPVADHGFSISVAGKSLN